MIPESNHERKPEPLYQVQVTLARDFQGQKAGAEILVGPRSNLKDMPAQLAEKINKAVALGKERDWRDARVVPVERIVN